MGIAFMVNGKLPKEIPWEEEQKRKKEMELESWRDGKVAALEERVTILEDKLERMYSWYRYEYHP
jgi:hypothetical protein